MNFTSTSQHKYLDTFNFSSLTDVVMQLLIFFLLTFSFANTRGMNVTLPKAQAGQPPIQKTISVSIAQDKKIFLNGDHVTKNQLVNRLAELIRKDSQQQIVVRADKGLQLQDVIDVLDIAKSTGATKLFIATEEATENR
ncbi:MAG: biopolymer transporter ExbD [Ignavibacteriae bacterium]|nr:biopolymer transporter ExbD [Ignavibacteriota bacterium]